jgi:hypothetical protein
MEESDSANSGRLIEALSPIQLRVLSLHGIPAIFCTIAFVQGKFNNSS